MATTKMNPELFLDFERGFNPRHPEQSVIPAKVLGYGEISTVLEINTEELHGLACKRMPMFLDVVEVENYLKLYREYIDVLGRQIGLNVASGETVWIRDREHGRVTAYILQEKIPHGTIGHQAIHTLPKEKVLLLVKAVLIELKKVFDFNREHRGEIEVGIDGQISNWSIKGFNPQKPALEEPVKLIYFDTSTPLTRKNGQEQLDPELFLRSAPSFLVWILRLFFVDDVMTRYYDFRRVAVDLIANFYKEQRPELIPDLINEVNTLLSSNDSEEEFMPITTKEVRSYYREDAMIWRLYLAFRKVDRILHEFFKRGYPYVLPDKVAR
jgi:hypothetical protein